jgi:hypothetical protein
VIISLIIRLLLINCVAVLWTILALSACTGDKDAFSVDNQPVFVDNGTNLEIASGIIIPFTLNQIIEGADVIISGTVSDILPSEEGPLLRDNDDTFIYTDVIINVNTCYIGQVEYDTIAIRTRGGRIGNNVLIDENSPEFKIGEQVVLYLADLDIGKPPDGMSMESVYKVYTTQGKALIQGDIVIHEDKDNSILSLQELIERISTVRLEKQE